MWILFNNLQEISPLMGSSTSTFGKIFKVWLIGILIIAAIAAVLVGPESFFFGFCLLPLLIIGVIIVILMVLPQKK